MKIYIQNMVSQRCKMMVMTELGKLGLNHRSIELGEVELQNPISEAERSSLGEELHKSGLELMDDKRAMLIEKIINLVVELVHYSTEPPQEPFSKTLFKHLKQDYRKLAEVFSKTKGVTIEHFIILHKVERIKELIIYDELNITEISYKLHYSSVAHLSNQFRQITGLTPSAFKFLAKRTRQNLEDL
jgi:AraC-like DNA-binding protein